MGEPNISKLMYPILFVIVAFKAVIHPIRLAIWVAQGSKQGEKPKIPIGG